MTASESCSLCDSDQAHELKAKTLRLGLKAPFKVVGCAQCGLERLSPQPTDEQYKHHYEEGEFYELDKYLARANQKLPIYRYAAERLQSNSTRVGRVLDLGCAGGSFLDEARKTGWQVVGVEPTQQLREYAQSDMKLNVYEDLDDFKQNVPGIDAAHASHVVEHLKDPRAVLTDIYNMMEPGGVFVIEVPNQFHVWIESLKIMWIKLTNNKLRWWKPTMDSLHHTYFFTPKTMRHMLEKVGYEVVDMRTFNPSYFETNVVPGAKHWVYRFAHSAFDLIGRGPIINCVARKPMAKAA